MSESSKTIPWVPSQKCLVNGIPCVYETSDGRVLEVILPGGAPISPGLPSLKPRRYLPIQLTDMGYRYEPPQVVRMMKDGVA